MDDNRNIELEVIGVIEDILEKEKNSILPSHTLDELKVDSILFIRLVVQCEANFNIEFEDEMLLISKFPDVDTFVKYVQKQYEYNAT